MLRRVLLGAAIGSAWLAGTISVQAATLKFGVAAEPYPPFTTQEASGKWVGFEVELMQAVCAAEKLDCEMVGTAWDGIIPALNAKKIDVIWSSMSITGERKQVIDFTDKYYNTPSEVIGPKGSSYKISTSDFSGLAGKTVGVQTSTIHANMVEKHFGKVNLKTYDTQDNANADLAAGRVDAVVADSVAMDDFLKSDQGKGCCESKLIIPADYDRSISGDGVGGGLRKSDTNLKAKLNEGIQAIRADGTYDKIAKKYFNFDVFGG